MSLTPTDGRELINQGLFHIVGWDEGRSDAGEVEEEVGFFFNGQDDIDHGGEAVFDGVGAGDGFTFGSGGTLGLSSVDAGLFGAGEFEGFGHG